MVIFAFETEESVELLRFIYETNVRLEEKNLVKNPFEGKIHTLIPNTYIVRMEPVYPKFYLFGLLAFMVTVFFARSWVWYIPSLAILSTYFLWSRYFYYIFIILGSRKAGHKNRLKLITGQETLSRLINRIYIIK